MCLGAAHLFTCLMPEFTHQQEVSQLKGLIKKCFNLPIKFKTLHLNLTALHNGSKTNWGLFGFMLLKCTKYKKSIL